MASWSGFRGAMAAAILVLLIIRVAPAYDVTDKFSIGGIVAGGYQYDGEDRSDGGAVTFRPHVSYHPSERDELFAKLGFAAGNGINDSTQFALAPWDADLEDDVKDINGRNRAALLTAWYKHTFTVQERSTLGVTGGLVDSWEYLDLNAFANDEYGQFMNEAFVNPPTAFLPSYDYGAALEFATGALSANAVLMNVGENDDGRGYWFWGMQLGYQLSTSWGDGNYRLLIDGTSKDFLDPKGLNEEALLGLTFSIDQELDETIGAFARIGWQQDDAAVDYSGVYSGGLNIGGTLWGRSADNLGLAYAYLSGGNGEVGRTHVVEAYLRVQFGEYIAVTADLQYMNENNAGANLQGWIPGVRVVGEF